MIYIYTLKCPIRNTIFYVGKTINPKERKNAHNKISNRGGLLLRNYLKFIKKHGLKSIFEILDMIEDEEDWSWLEQYWISQFKVWGFELKNWTNGGEKQYHFKHTEETKKIIREQQKGRKLSKEWCENISMGKTGVKFSEKHLLNLSISHKGLLNENNLKAVYQLDFEFNILNKFNSISDALRFLNLNVRDSSITRVCKKKMKSAYGYHWCYYEDFDTLDKEFFNINICKNVIKIDIKTEKVIDEYSSVKEAAKNNNCHYTAISHICNDKQGSINGYIFLFKCDFDPILIKEIKKLLNVNINYK